MTRAFSREPLVEGVVDELLDLARRAPSAGFSQGVHFIVLSGADVTEFWRRAGALEWFSPADPSTPSVLDAPVVVLPVAVAAEYTTRYAAPDKLGHGLDDAANWPVPFWLTDAAMAVQNLLLLAEDRGLGALFFGIFRNADEYIASLGAPSGAQAVGAVALGHRHPADTPTGSPRTRRRRPLTDVVHHHRW